MVYVNNTILPLKNTVIIVYIINILYLNNANIYVNVDY